MASINADKIIDDIELQLNQGTISDDSELSREQIRYWLEVEANFMIRQECDSVIKVGKQINPIYISRSTPVAEFENTFFGVSLISAITSQQAQANPYVYEIDTGKYYRMLGSNTRYMEMTEAEAEKIKSKQRIYVTLDAAVLDIFNDAGIVRVMTEDYEMVNKASTETIEMVQHLRFAGPKKNTPVYYRVNNIIYVDGLNDSEVYEKNFIVDYVPYQSATGSMKISDLILPSVIDRVLQRGKLQMYGSSQDPMNDGEDAKQSVYHTAIQNPAKEQAQ